jgi:hypothetical protein
VPARSLTAFAATSCLSATWHSPRFGIDAEPYATGTCWCARWFRSKIGSQVREDGGLLRVRCEVCEPPSE